MINNNNNSSHNKKTRRRNSTANATSPLAMGKALVLTITVGSAAAFSGGSNSAIQTQRISTSRRIHHTSPNYNRHFLHNPNHSNNNNGEAFHSIGALHYREGDEDQSSSMRVANRSAVDEATGNTATTISTETPHSSSSRGVSKVNLFMPIVGLMPSMPPVPSQHSVEEDKEQLAMDQYLEYIDRRYSRLKPTSHNKRPKGGVIMDIPHIRKIFLSTLSLHKLPILTAAAFGTTAISSSEEEKKKKAKEAREVRREALRRNGESEDALKSLGLSSLASARLQQRLHVPRDLRDEYMSLTSGTTNAVNFINHIVHLNDVPVILSPKSQTTDNKAVTADMEGGRTSSYTSLSFTAQFKLLFSTLRNVTMAFVNTMQILTAFASRMASEVLDKGGFRRSVRLMSVVPIMLVFMFKPLFRGAMKQGTKV